MNVQATRKETSHSVSPIVLSGYVDPPTLDEVNAKFRKLGAEYDELKALLEAIRTNPKYHEGKDRPVPRVSALVSQAEARAHDNNFEIAIDLMRQAIEKAKLCIPAEVG